MSDPSTHDTVCFAQKRAVADYATWRHNKMCAKHNLNPSTTIVTGKHIWSAPRSSPTARPTDSLSEPLLPYTELPFPHSELATLSPCTIRWKFTGRFSYNKEEDIARGSLGFQVKRYLEYKHCEDLSYLVTFHCVKGRAGRYVDIHVAESSMAALAETPLVFRGARPQLHLVGTTLSKTSFVVEVSARSALTGSPQALADTFANFLQQYAKVHDIWVEMLSSSTDSTVRVANKLVALVETEPTADGYRDFDKVTAIPGWVKIGGQECRVDYRGRLEWCTSCRSSTALYHPFEYCLRRP